MSRDHEQRAALYAGTWAGVAERKRQADIEAAERAKQAKEDKKARDE